MATFFWILKKNENLLKTWQASIGNRARNRAKKQLQVIRREQFHVDSHLLLLKFWQDEHHVGGIFSLQVTSNGSSFCASTLAWPREESPTPCPALLLFSEE